MQRVNRARRRLSLALGVLMIAMIGIAGTFLTTDWLHPLYDYRGSGDSDVLIEVHRNDTTEDVGETLKEAGVIATVPAFLDASYGNNKIAAIQPGFYQTRTRIPAATAVEQLTDPNHRMGLVVIPEGSQLDDTTYIGTGALTPGIFSRIAEASCVDLNGEHHCIDVADLSRAAATASLQELEVPAWAADRVAKMGDDHRRIEGLIAARTWNIDPMKSAQDALATLIRDSADYYDKSGLRATANTLQMEPYDVLVVASLVQKEAQPDDYAKVARVVYNRLDTDSEMLQFDSTVNYPLARREVATGEADRHASTPWNTYVIIGLPATPICSPGDDVLAAAEHPEPGDWLYFVTVDKDGTTVFTDDYQEHLSLIEQAQANGVLESNR